MYLNILSHLTASLPLLVPSLLILIISISLAILLKRKLAETVFLSNSVVILILFLTGILNFKGSLLLGYAIIIILALFSLGFIIRSYIKNKKITKEISLLPGLILFLVFLLIAIYLNYGRMFIIWDEFSHWGSVLKHMYSLDALASLKDSVGHFLKTYPPASSLFQYFWMRPFREFTEYPAYIASNMFFFSLVMMFLRRFNVKNYFFLIIFILIPVAIPLISGYSFFSSLYVDAILGIMLGVMLLTYYRDDIEDDLYRYVVICALSSLLTLIKDTGLIFALIGGVIILIDFIVFRAGMTKNFLDHLKKDKDYLRKLFLATLPLLVTVLSKFLLSMHLKLVVEASSVVENGPMYLQKILRRDFLPYQKETIANFATALIQKPLAPLESPFLKLIILLSSIFLIYNILIVKNKLLKKRLIVSFLGLILGGIGYSLSILVVYLFVFGSNEAVILASYTRYMLSYFIAFFTFLLVFFVVRTESLPKKTSPKKSFSENIKAIIFVSLSLYLSHVLINKVEIYLPESPQVVRQSVQDTIIARKEFDKSLIWKEYLQDPKRRTYIIAQGSVGYETLVLIHTLYPTHITWTRDYSVGTELYHNHPSLGDPWTMIISPEDWSKYVLDNYDLVYIFRYDEKFKQTYGHYFDTLENNALYDVTTNSSGILELVSVPKP